MYSILVIVGLLASASAKDLIVGHEEGTSIFKQNVTASPTIWRQMRNLTINATEHEVITRVVVIDNREDKNGEATIVEGGEGSNNVTIELKSPAVFRGFDFEVQVYAKPLDGAQKPVDNDQQEVKDLSPDTDVNEQQVPRVDSGEVIKGLVTPVPKVPVVDTQEQVGQQEKDKKEVTPVPIPSAPAQEPNGQVAVQHPVVAGKDNEQQVPQQSDKTFNEQAEEQQPQQPRLLRTRHVRHL